MDFLNGQLASLDVYKDNPVYSTDETSLDSVAGPKVTIVWHQQAIASLGLGTNYIVYTQSIIPDPTIYFCEIALRT